MRLLSTLPLASYRPAPSVSLLPIMLLLLGPLLLALAAPLRAATLNVPSQYSTIQAAINVSANGDTVLIADGRYTGPGNVDLDFGGKNITVTSQNGASSTIIDCQGSSSANHRGFYLHSGETNAMISGLTIENGYESIGVGNGGAIDTEDVGWTIQNCIIENNTAPAGGGIFNSDAAVTVENCVIMDNAASGSEGGGIYIANLGFSSTITNCTIANNTAPSSDGAGLGGGIFASSNGSAKIAVADCTLSGNSAFNGGGICNTNTSKSTIINCTLTANSASPGGFGGGIYNYNNSGTIAVANCTITNNIAPSGDGGGIYNYKYDDTGTITLANNILYGDTGGEVLNDGGSTVTPIYCDIQGGYAGTGNLSADPLFVGAPANLHLKPGSPCLQAGTASVAPATDLDGSPRPTPPSIGAYDLVELSALGVPASVPGGTVITATVTLDGVALTDTVIGLGSSNPSVVRINRGVIVPAGSSSATFTINTYRSHVTQSVTVRASEGAQVLTMPLTITGR